MYWCSALTGEEAEEDEDDVKHEEEDDEDDDAGIFAAGFRPRRWCRSVPEVLFARMATRALTRTMNRNSTEGACPGGASDSVHRQRHGHPWASPFLKALMAEWILCM